MRRHAASCCPTALLSPLFISDGWLQVQVRQVNALLRKSWAYQRKNICSNVFILVAPIVICALLGVLQTLLDNLISEDAKVTTRLLLDRCIHRQAMLNCDLEAQSRGFTIHGTAYGSPAIGPSLSQSTGAAWQCHAD